MDARVLPSRLTFLQVKDQFFKWTRNFNTEAIVGSALQKAVKEVVEHESSTIQAETDKPKDEKETRKQTVRRRRRWVGTRLKSYTTMAQVLNFINCTRALFYSIIYYNGSLNLPYVLK